MASAQGRSEAHHHSAAGGRAGGQRAGGWRSLRDRILRRPDVLFTLPLPDSRFSEAQVPWRAGLLTLAGATIICYFSWSFGPTFFSADIAVVGLGIGLTIAVLALIMLWYPNAAGPIGMFAVVGGLIAFPIAAGGLVVGSLLVIAGGSLAAAWTKAGPDAVVAVRPAGLPIRAVVALMDLAIAGVIILILFATVFNSAAKSHLTVWYLLQLFGWLIVVGPGASRGLTPGRLLLGTRAIDSGGELPISPGRAIRRELLRALEITLTVQILAISARYAAWPVTLVVFLLLVGGWLFGMRKRSMPHDVFTKARMVAVSVTDDVALTAAPADDVPPAVPSGGRGGDEGLAILGGTSATTDTSAT